MPKMLYFLSIFKKFEYCAEIFLALYAVENPSTLGVYCLASRRGSRYTPNI